AVGAGVSTSSSAGLVIRATAAWAFSIACVTSAINCLRSASAASVVLWSFMYVPDKVPLRPQQGVPVRYARNRHVRPVSKLKGEQFLNAGRASHATANRRAAFLCVRV